MNQISLGGLLVVNDCKSQVVTGPDKEEQSKKFICTTRLSENDVLKSPVSYGSLVESTIFQIVSYKMTPISGI